MRKEIFLAITLVLLVGCGFFYPISIQSSSQEEADVKGGVISGIVLNHEGQPVAKADVIAVSARGSRSIRPHTVTDAKGNFTIAGLKPGTYFMEAKKESEGYASTIGTFHSAGLAEAPKVVVLENQTVAGIILRFGPRSARVTGRIIDARSRKSVEDAQIILRRADNPKQFYATSVENRFNLLVPPVPFTIEVKASGYQDWTFSNDGSGKRMDALHLASGTRRDLTIALHPLK